jgi:general stress protein 26
MTTAAAGRAEVEKLADIIKDIEYAMLTTAMPDGSLRSRPMATQKAPFDGTLWFFTDADSAKVHEVEGDSHVNVAYADPAHNRWVSVAGTARVVRDRAKIKELWTPPLKAWFPKGPEEPNIALLRVDVAGAEYWDAPSNKMVQLVGFVKAVVTGKRYEPGENEKIDLARGR